MIMLHEPYPSTELDRRRERVTRGVREQGRVRRLAAPSESAAHPSARQSRLRGVRGLAHRLVHLLTPGN